MVLLILHVGKIIHVRARSIVSYEYHVICFLLHYVFLHKQGPMQTTWRVENIINGESNIRNLFLLCVWGVGGR